MDNLAHSEARYRQIVNNLPIGFYVTTLDGRMVEANLAFLRITGYASLEAINQVGVPALYANPADRQRLIAMLQHGPVASFETHFRRADGEIVNVSISVRLVQEPGVEPCLEGILEDITERKRTEEAIRDSEEKLRAIYEGTNDAVMLLDEKGFFDCNPRTLEMFGFKTKAEFTAVHPADVSPPFQPDGQASLPAAQERIQTAYRQGYNRFEWMHRRTDGQDFSAEVLLSAFDFGGQRVLQATVRDITGRKRAEEALHESEDRLRTLIDAMPDLVIFKDGEGRYLEANDYNRRFFQLEQVECRGKTDAELASFTPFYRDALMGCRETDEAAWRARTMSRCDETIARPDGSSVIFDTIKVPTFYPDGRRKGLVVVGRDITERKRVEEALRASEVELRALFAAMTDVILVLDAQGRYLKVAPTNPPLLYRPAVTLEGQTLHQILPPPQADAFLGYIRQALASNQMVNFEYSLELESGSTWFAATVSPMLADRVIWVARDITQRKQLEQQIRESLERRGRQVQTSTEVAQEIAAAPALDELFRRVVTLIKERFGYYHAQLFRYEAEQDAMLLVTGYGEAGAKMLAAGHKLAMGRGVVGMAAATGQSVLAANVEQDADWRPNPNLPQTRGELAVPIKLRDEVLGILDVQSAQAGALTAEDQLLLEGLCGQIAAAIHSTRLFEQTQAALAETRALYHLSRSVISFQDLPSLLQTVVDNVAGLLPADRVSLKTFDLENRAITHFVKGGPGADHILTTITFDELWDGLSGWALRELKPVLSPKDVPDPRESLAVQQRRREYDCGAIVVTPLIYRDRVLGTITAINRPDQANFTQKDVDLMVSMANQVAAAIENVRLFEQTQAALAAAQQSEQLMHTLIDNIPNPIFYKDPRGVYRGCNAAFEAYMGQPKDWIVGKSVYDMAPKDLADKYHVMDQELFDHPGVQVYESLVRYADGVRRNVMFNKATFTNADGSLGGLVGVMVDITERKQAEIRMQELLNNVQQSEHLMRSLIDATPDWIFIKDREHRYRLANQGYAQALHLCPEDFIGKNDLDLGFPEELVMGNPAKGIRGFWADDRLVMDTGETQMYPNDPATIDGVVHTFHTIKTPLRDADGHIWGVLAFARDVTESERAQVQVKETLQELERLYRSTTREGWQALRERALLSAGYVFDRATVSSAEDVWSPQIAAAVRQGGVAQPADQDAAVVAPLQVRGEIIGALGVQGDPRRPLSPDEVELLQEIVEQGALALESARLFENASDLAARERMINEITARIRGSMTVDGILSAAAREISQVAGADSTVIEFQVTKTE